MTKSITLQIQTIHPEIELPAYAIGGSAGMDLRASEEATILPGKWVCVPTGLKMMIPEGYEGQVRPRSGLAAKHGVTVLNSPGTIDASYRGEIKVLLINFGDSPFIVEKGMRMAQLVIAEVVAAQCVPVKILEETDRGEGGFGSTGFS